LSLAFNGSSFILYIAVHYHCGLYRGQSGLRWRRRVSGRWFT